MELSDADVESQPLPLPPPPKLSARLARVADATVAWVAEDPLLTTWEAQIGFPLMGDWTDMPATSQVAVVPAADMMFLEYSLAVSPARPTEWRGVVRGLDAGVSYVFRVRGVNESGAGAWSSCSNTVTVQPDGSLLNDEQCASPAPPVPPHQSLRAVARSDSRFIACRDTWTDWALSWLATRESAEVQDSNLKLALERQDQLRELRRCARARSPCALPPPESTEADEAHLPPHDCGQCEAQGARRASRKDRGSKSYGSRYGADRAGTTPAEVKASQPSPGRVE